MVRKSLALVAAALMTIGLAACGKSSATSPTTAVVMNVTGTAPSVGKSAQYDAQIVFENGIGQDATTSATWASSNPAIATVSSTGVVTGVSVGTAFISATQSGVTGTAQTNVGP